MTIEEQYARIRKNARCFLFGCNIVWFTQKTTVWFGPIR